MIRAGKLRNKYVTKQGYRCKDCRRYFIERDGFEGMTYPKEIIAAVLRLYRDPALGRRMADEGRRSVAERFTIDRMVTSQIDCYRRWLPAETLRAADAHAGGRA